MSTRAFRAALILLTAGLLTAGCSSSPASPESGGEGAAPPWIAAKVSAVDAPLVRSVWASSENRETCAPMTFASLGEGSGATARQATFAGGWGVAFDKPGLPGMTSTGARCETCGRSAFGIAGTGAVPSADTYRWPDHWQYADGSSVTYGLEGGTGPGWLGYVVVNGQECLYNVWSNVSEQHIRHLIDQMRFVETKGVQ